MSASDLADEYDAVMADGIAASLRRAIEGYADDELAMLTGFIRRLRSVVAGTAESARLRRS